MATQDIKPLDGQFFSTLIKLESDFAARDYTAETLDELVDYYSTAIEYYDSIKDQIASYFIYKMQNTLAQKKSFKLLKNESIKLSTPKGNQVKDFFGTKGGSDPNSAASTDGGSPAPKRHAPRVSFMGGIIAEHMNESSDQSDNEDQDDEYEEEELNNSFDDEDEEEGLSMAEMRMRARNRQKSARKSIATLKKKAQKLFILQMKLQEEKAGVKQTLHAVMDTFAQTSQTNDNLVVTNLNNQRKNYRKRLAERLHHKAHHRTSSLGQGQQDFTYDNTGSTIINDMGGNSPNLGSGLLHDGNDQVGSSF